ncbi:unnamed protein product [Periconia digitata]|uniref:Uncharacterized protein n=1 Tax=Periconia digitata TaxID=1303443 RepID=A0A9W4UD69_9PLEO|nr:unnamed protein product [Periconia digitata]
MCSNYLDTSSIRSKLFESTVSAILFQPLITYVVKFLSYMISYPKVFEGRASDARCWVEKSLADLMYYRHQSVGSNLDNSIHAVFDFKRFQNADKILYQKMIPALQLATLFLTEDSVLDWFYHDTVGILKTYNSFPDDSSHYPYLAANPNFNLENPEQRKAARKLWLRKLEKLSHVLKFYFYEGNDLLRLWGATYHFSKDMENDLHSAALLSSDDIWRARDGSLRSRLIHWPYSASAVNNLKTQPAVLIGNAYRVFLEQKVSSDITSAPYLQQQEYMNCSLSLALTLVHEVAHAVSSFPYMRFIEPVFLYPCEVYSSFDEMCSQRPKPPEAGHSWERSVFGELHPGVSAPLADGRPESDCSFYSGSDISPFSTLSCNIVVKNSAIFGAELAKLNTSPAVYIFGQSDIIKFFRKQHWAQLRSKRDLNKQLAPAVLLRVYMVKDSVVTNAVGAIPPDTWVTVHLIQASQKIDIKNNYDSME